MMAIVSSFFCSFFFSLVLVELCSRGISSSWTGSQSKILLRSVEAIERECAREACKIVEYREWFVHHNSTPARNVLSVT